MGRKSNYKLKEIGMITNWNQGKIDERARSKWNPRKDIHGLSIGRTAMNSNDSVQARYVFYWPLIPRFQNKLIWSWKGKLEFHGLGMWEMSWDVFKGIMKMKEKGLVYNIEVVRGEAMGLRLKLLEGLLDSNPGCLTRRVQFLICSDGREVQDSYDRDEEKM